MSNGFVHGVSDFGVSDVNRRWFHTDTDSFVLLPEPPPNNIIYITCFVGYCFGAVESDGRCTDVS